jgi:TonB family protein
MRRFVFAICVLFFVLASADAHNKVPTVSVLDFGETDFGRQAAEKLRTRFRATRELNVADVDLTLSAARGIGYTGSLNLTLSEARDLGAALATDFYVLGDAQVVRRSSSKLPVYYEAYCSVFLVSARTGRLLLWERPAFESPYANAARLRVLQDDLDAEVPHRLLGKMLSANEKEKIERVTIVAAPPIIEEAPDNEQTAEAQGLRAPRPFRRLRPEYPDSAARAEAEATVDVLADVSADGEVGEVQVVRWAGFGLDEATIATVKQIRFFPAMKNGVAIPMRVLLRYNFRKPPPR